MTPKEKVIELLSKYNFVDNCQECGGSFKAKQCALICIDEMMEAIPLDIEPLVYMSRISYLDKVKTEINKL